MKILIVDDSPESLAVAAARLEKDNLTVICAESGQAGLETAKRENPDLILLDVDMPDMSGFDVCRALKTDRDLCMIPVIFLTVMDNTVEMVRGLDLGAVDYVKKPFDVFELRARVRAALRTKRFQDLLIEYAHIDPLTELPNRRALMERLEQEWARVQRHGGTLSFIMADVDNFKQINDRFGHHIGDKFLQEVAKIILGECRDMDLPARYGGDEFAIIAPNELAADAATLAERCRQRIECVRVQIAEETIHTTTSFGIADSTSASSAQDLVEKADKSLYDAKNAGRNVVKCRDSSPETPVGTGAGKPPGVAAHNYRLEEE